jgi:DNA-directed RNA polymerase specialized sigma24 family protein
MDPVNRIKKESQEEIFISIFNEFRDKILRLCFAYLDNRSFAEDIFLEVLMAIWLGLKTFRKESSYGTWVYRITVNTVFLFNKRELKRKPAEMRETLVDTSVNGREDQQDQGKNSKTIKSVDMEPLVELWQQATIDESRMDRTYQREDLVPMIIQLEKKQQQLLRIKTLIVLILLPAIVIIFLNRTILSLNSVMGLGIFTISVLVVTILLNRLRFKITEEERGRTTMELTRIAGRKIHMEKKLFATYLPLFLVVALSGFNLMIADTFTGEEQATRLLYHLIMTGSLVLAFVLGLTVRIRRFHKQFLPVLSRIRKFEQEAESDLE